MFTCRYVLCKKNYGCGKQRCYTHQTYRSFPSIVYNHFPAVCIECDERAWKHTWMLVGIPCCTTLFIVLPILILTLS